jgi:hypothetical protein
MMYRPISARGADVLRRPRPPLAIFFVLPRAACGYEHCTFETGAMVGIW